MLKITYKTLSDQLFLQGLQQLSFHRDWTDHEELFKVKDLFKKCRFEQKKAGKEWSEISLKYANKTEDGKIDFVDSKGGYDISEDKKDAFNKARDDFDKKYFEMDMEPLKLNCILAAGVSPAELGSMETIIEPRKLKLVGKGKETQVAPTA